MTDSGPLGLADDGTPFHRASFAYDSEGRIESASVGARTMTYAYHNLGDPDPGHREPSLIIDPIGRTTRYNYDAARRLVSTTLPDQTQITMDLDPAGNATHLRFETGPAGDSEVVDHEQRYTPLGLEKEYVPPAPAPEPDDPGDWSTNREYDLDRLLTSLRHPGDAGDRPVDIARSAATGRPTGVTFAGQSVGIAYDATGRQSQLTAGTETLAYGYDGPLLVRETWGGTVAASLHTAYDDELRPHAQAVTASGSPPSPPPGPAWTHWLYEPTTWDMTGVVTSTGATLSVTYRNALGGPRATRVGVVATTAHIDAYAELSDLDASTDGDPADTTLFSQAFVRDALGRITALDETIVDPTTGDPESRAVTYSYHPLTGRLALVSDGPTSEAYDYDLNGNRVLAGGEAEYDRQDRMARFGEWHYEHDAMGQREAKFRLVDGQRADETTYDYDALGRLLGVVLPDGAELTYIHDPLGRRIAMSRDGVIEHRLVYGDGLHPIAEVDADGDVVAEYVFFTRAHCPDLLVRDGVVYRYVTDHLGSVRLLVRADTGDVVFRQDYDTWGRVTSSWTAPLVDVWQPFGFAGGIYDAATGLVRFGARDYDPEVGRWTAKDPIRWGGGQLNLYVYVGDDPINYNDATGTSKGGKRNLRGNDEAITELADAFDAGGKKAVDAVKDAWGEKFKQCKITRKRWEDIQAWAKTIKDGRFRVPGALLPCMDSMTCALMKDPVGWLEAFGETANETANE